MNRARGRLLAASVAAALLAAGCSPGSDGAIRVTPDPIGTTSSPAPTTGTPGPLATTPRRVQVLVRNLVVPWGLGFLPNGDALVTERETARIFRVTPFGQVSEVQRLAEVLTGSGEGGLLGLAVSPNYQHDQLVYVYYTTAGGNVIARMRLGDRPDPIVEGIPSGTNHNGGRLIFGPDGMLYAGTGESGNPPLAQDRASLGGKILRMTPDGTPAPGNPFPGSLVWTYGHRNVQGLAFDPAGRLWATEFGQSTFDEINLIEAGRNYGWPNVEGPSTDPQYVTPKVTWSTAEASPSGLAYFRGSLFAAALRGQRLWRVPLDGAGNTGTPQALLTGQYGRLRTVAVAPDRSLWVMTSNRDGRKPGGPQPDDDRILRLTF